MQKTSTTPQKYRQKPTKKRPRDKGSKKTKKRGQNVSKHGSQGIQVVSKCTPKRPKMGLGKRLEKHLLPSLTQMAPGVPISWIWDRFWSHFVRFQSDFEGVFGGFREVFSITFLRGFVSPKPPSLCRWCCPSFSSRQIHIAPDSSRQFQIAPGDSSRQLLVVPHSIRQFHIAPGSSRQFHIAPHSSTQSFRSAHSFPSALSGSPCHYRLI